MRVSVALLIEPDAEEEIGPVDGLVDEETPKLYKTVKSYGHLNFVCFQKGVVAIHAVKIGTALRSSDNVTTDIRTVFYFEVSLFCFSKVD
ncbi:hypothetical protein TIFTF001_016537 [Ficus carica]|uniref:Uncharacterized protein n=1 Tax=Ficus carica TaxID=3494 RepID=A0AA88ANW2_FICCA|nr:hypothetical protein TIFTF001_016537 [Ficus carica]